MPVDPAYRPDKSELTGLRPGEVDALLSIRQREDRDRARKKAGNARWLEERAEEKRLEQAAREGRVTAGMSEDQARGIMGGRPSRINRSDYGDGEREQWVYNRPDGATYIYVRGGKVTGAQR